MVIILLIGRNREINAAISTHYYTRFVQCTEVPVPLYLPTYLQR